MTLEQWSSNNWLRAHSPTVAEIGQLFALVDRDLSDAGQGVSADNRFNLAYNAALKLCTIALHAEGYTTRGGGGGHHNYVINSLSYTLGEQHKEIEVYLSTCSQKRHQAMYEQVGVASEKDAEELVQTARQLRTEVLVWLKAQHDELVPDTLRQ